MRGQMIPLCPQRAHDKLVNLATWVWALQTALPSAVPHEPRKHLGSCRARNSSPITGRLAMSSITREAQGWRGGSQHQELKDVSSGDGAFLAKLAASGQQCRPTLHRREASGANDMELLCREPLCLASSYFRESAYSC